MSARIECSVPEELLDKTEGVIDDDRRFGRWVEYHLKGTDVRVARLEGTYFEKVNGFADPTAHGEIDADGMIHVELTEGSIVKMLAAELDKALTQGDSEEEFWSAVEFRLRGTDKIVHRSTSVMKKKLPSLTGEQGRIG